MRCANADRRHHSASEIFKSVQPALWTARGSFLLLGGPCHIFSGKGDVGRRECEQSFCRCPLGNGRCGLAGYPELLKEGIALGLSGEGYTDEQVQAYFKRAGRLSVTKTHGRRPVAGLNRAVERLFGLTADADKTRKYQALHSRFANEERCSAAGFSDKGCPRDFLEEDMKRTGILKQKEI